VAGGTPGRRLAGPGSQHLDVAGLRGQSVARGLCPRRPVRRQRRLPRTRQRSEFPVEQASVGGWQPEQRPARVRGTPPGSPPAVAVPPPAGRARGSAPTARTRSGRSARRSPTTRRRRGPAIRPPRSRSHVRGRGSGCATHPGSSRDSRSPGARAATSARGVAGNAIGCSRSTQAIASRSPRINKYAVPTKVNLPAEWADLRPADGASRTGVAHPPQTGLQHGRDLAEFRRATPPQIESLNGRKPKAPG
jgi:hypothetical protein